MSRELTLIGPALVQRDADGWWQHPQLPAFAEDPDAFRAWLAAQGLELAAWTMEGDGLDDHPYWDAASPRHDCRGWAPRSPGPEWFLLSLFDSEDGPYVNWVRRVAAGEGVERPSGGLLAVAVDESKRLTLTVDPWVDDMRPGVVVKDGVLVIAVTTDALLHGITLGGGWPTNERGATVAIQDGALMVKDVVNELLREDEQGTTAVHRLFDEAAEAALDNGSEAVDYDTWVPA